MAFLHAAGDRLGERARRIEDRHQLDHAALRWVALDDADASLRVVDDGIDRQAEAVAVRRGRQRRVGGCDHDAHDPRQPEVAAAGDLAGRRRVVRVHPHEHAVRRSRVHVAPAGARHQRHHVESSPGELDGLGVGVGRLQHQRVEALTAPVERRPQGLAERCRRVGRRHQLDVAAARRHAHPDVGAEARHGARREVHDGHPEGIPERRDGGVEVLDGDGDAGHGGDHGAPPGGPLRQ